MQPVAGVLPTAGLRDVRSQSAVRYCRRKADSGNGNQAALEKKRENKSRTVRYIRTVSLTRPRDRADAAR